jgi:hypothetical protein
MWWTIKVLQTNSIKKLDTFSLFFAGMKHMYAIDIVRNELHIISHSHMENLLLQALKGQMNVMFLQTMETICMAIYVKSH